MTPPLEHYVKRGTKLKRFKDSLEKDFYVPPVNGAARFYGDPGRGKLLLGANHVDGGTIAKVNTLEYNPATGRMKPQADGLPIDQFELSVFPASEGYTAASRVLMPMVREYSTDLYIPSGTRSKIDGWGAQGRICNMSFQTTSDPDGNTPAKVLAAISGSTGNTVKSGITSMINWFISCGYPVFPTLNHEPQSGDPAKVTPAQAADHRALWRALIEFAESLGLRADYGWVGPHPVSNDYSTNQNWLMFHPEYLNASDGWSTRQYLAMDGWDPYNPRLAAGLPIDANGEQHFDDGARTKKYSTRLYPEYKDRVKGLVGYHQKPLNIGELGLYAYDDWLWDATAGDNGPGGITMDVFFQDLADTCYQTNTVGVSLWNNSLAGYTSLRDPYDQKRTALRRLFKEDHPRVVKAGWGNW